MMAKSTDELCINTIRTLATDAAQQANSGHPGTAIPTRPNIPTRGGRRKGQ